VLGNGADTVLGNQPTGDSMHSHEPDGGLPPPPTRPTLNEANTGLTQFVTEYCRTLSFVNMIILSHPDNK